MLTIRQRIVPILKGLIALMAGDRILGRCFGGPLRVAPFFVRSTRAMEPIARQGVNWASDVGEAESR
ncbi:hypothetical protein BGLA2_700017 [Burkholderia gladioli]|nr:hypothetical protein BGLA2_700017 [Burkholderia gladioli]